MEFGGIQVRSRVSMQGIVLLLLATVVASVGFGQPASAEGDSAEPGMKAQFMEVWNRDLLTSDWAGMRTQLHDRGIDVGLRLSQYGQGVASGGVDQNGAYGGTMDYRVDADLKKLFGSWDGLSISMHARTRFGEDVLADAGALAIPNTGLLMPAPGGYHGTDVTGLTINQLFPIDDKHVGLVTLGKLDILDAVTLFFPSVGYGQEGFWNVNALVSALPWVGAVRGLSLYGGWVATMNTEYGMGQSAFLFTGTENVTTSWSASPGSFEEGAWLAAFHRFFWKLDDKTGYFMIFGGGSTREQFSNDPNDIAFIPNVGLGTEQKRPWDIAAYIYQVIWEAEDDPTRNATIFIGGTGGPDNPQFAQWNIFAAVEAFGPMASRPHDRMGVSGWYNGLSKNFIELASIASIDLQDTWGVELYYNIQINKWIHITPDLQVVQNQNVGDDVAVIPGIRWVMDF